MFVARHDRIISRRAMLRQHGRRNRRHRIGVDVAGNDRPRAGCRFSYHRARQSAGAESPALCAQSQAGHFSVHERRPIARRYFRSETGLVKYNGQDPPAEMTKKVIRKGKLMQSPFKTIPCGDSGIEITELFPEISKCIDDLCILRSMHADSPQHERALLFMNSGNIQPIRPSLGSWVTYGLGTENQNLPGFVVMCPGKPVVGPQLWSNSFLPAVYQGTHINNSSLDSGSPLHFLHNSVESTRRSAARDSTCCKK